MRSEKADRLLLALGARGEPGAAIERRAEIKPTSAMRKPATPIKVSFAIRPVNIVARPATTTRAEIKMRGRLFERVVPARVD
jgi:hypothetical protein